MVKKFKNLFIVLAVCFLTMCGVGFASDVTVSVSSLTLEKNGSGNVTVSVKSGATIGAYTFTISYDSSVAEFVSSSDPSSVNGGAGLIRIADSPFSTGASYTLSFKGIAPGTTSLSLNVTEVIDGNADDMNVKKSNGSITVNKPREASKDCSLKSLSVGGHTLTPAFSPDVYQYTVNVDNSVNSLDISAIPNSSAAWTQIGGNDFSGTNRSVNIVCVAENGDRKDYYITVTKADATPSPIPTETPTPTPGVKVKARVLVNKDGKFVYEDTDMQIADTISAATPVGFDKSSMAVDGVAIECLKQADGKLVLVELSDGELYIYDKDENVYTPFQVIKAESCSYIICLADESQIPAGYEVAEIIVNGKAYPAYRMSEKDEMVLVMTESGRWYTYDLVEGTLQRIVEIQTEIIETTPVPTFTATPTPEQGGISTPANVDETDKKDKNTMILYCIIGALAFFALLFLILFIAMKRKYNRVFKDEEDKEVDLDKLASSKGADVEPPVIDFEDEEPEGLDGFETKTLGNEEIDLDEEEPAAVEPEYPEITGEEDIDDLNSKIDELDKQIKLAEQNIDAQLSGMNTETENYQPNAIDAETENYQLSDIDTAAEDYQLSDMDIDTEDYQLEDVPRDVINSDIEGLLKRSEELGGTDELD